MFIDTWFQQINVKNIVKRKESIWDFLIQLKKRSALMIW